MPLQAGKPAHGEQNDHDLRAFDAAVLRAALVFYNGIYAERSSTAALDRQALAREAFADIPRLVTERARAAGIDSKTFRWQKVKDRPLIEAGAALRLINVGLRPLIAHSSVRRGTSRVPIDEWLDSALETLPIYSRFHVTDAGVRMVSVPFLTDAARCAVYALGVLLSGAHDLHRYVRPCPLLLRPGSSSVRAHYFLATDVGGAPPRNAPSKYCSAAHANRHRARQFRRRHPRKPK